MWNRIFAIILTVSVILHSAKTQSFQKDFIQATVGFGLPVGVFGSKDFSKSPGLAKPGYSGTLSVGYKLLEYAGAATQLRIQSNPLNVKAFADILLIVLPSGVTAEYNSKDWTQLIFLVGPYGSISIGPSWKISPKIMLGLSVITKPALDFQFSNNTWVKQTGSTAIAFTSLIGANADHQLSKKWFVTGSLDFSQANPNFKDISISNSQGKTQITNGKIKVKSINCSVGIGFRF